MLFAPQWFCMTSFASFSSATAVRYLLAMLSVFALIGCADSAPRPNRAATRVPRRVPELAPQRPRSVRPAPPVTEPLSLFSRQHLVKVDIEIAEPAWTALRMQTRSMATALRVEPGPRPFTYFRGDVTINGETFKSVGIRKKGFIGSLDNERPSLKIKLNHFDDGTRTIGGLDRLTLNNNKQDRSLASQYLSYHVFDQAGVPAPRCNLAVVTVNGRNLGVYSNVEAVKTQFLERAFGTATGAIFEGTLTDFFSDRLDRFDSKVNKEWSKTHGRKILHKLCQVLEADGPTTTDQLDELVDLHEFVTFWAVESLIGFWDGYSGNQNNFFVYTAEGAKIQFIPWGVDAAFSNRRFGFRGDGYKSVLGKGLLANRLNQDPDIREMYQFVLEVVLDKAWDEDALVADVDRIEALAGDHLHPRQEGLQESLNQVRRFIQNRRAEIEEETSGGAIALQSRTRRPMHTVVVGKMTGSFNTQWNGSQGDPVPQATGARVKGKAGGGSFTIDHLSAIAGMGRARQWGRGGTQPTITLVGTRSTDNEIVTVTIVVPPAFFRSDVDHSIKVQGRFSQGERRRGWGSGMLDGQLTLRQARRVAGARVAGTFDLDLYEMRGRGW